MIPSETGSTRLRRDLRRPAANFVHHSFLKKKNQKIPAKNGFNKRKYVEQIPEP
jgi:hypothetical protein